MSALVVMMDGEKIAAMRTERGVSLEDAAEYIGLEPHVLSGIEKGYRQLTPKQAEEIDSGLKKLSARPAAEVANRG